MAGAVEYGSWNGTGSLSLRPHFHDETQITIVLAGRRVFRLDDHVVVVTSGHGLVVPAGQLHVPIAVSNCDTVCVNLYVDDDYEYHPARIFKILTSELLGDAFPPVAALRAARGMLPSCLERLTPEIDHGGLRAALADSGRRIGEIAADFEMSREGFSRRVLRELGVAPHCFRIVSRLNRARRLLRDGQTIASVAAEAGFSDQSHLTRLFRETFGTTPSHYRRG